MLQNIIRTKIIPPPQNPRSLNRKRVTELLQQSFEYNVTVMQAETGYGKSTALADLFEVEDRIAWYHLYNEDNDPLVFALSLCHSLQTAIPHISNLPINFLLAWDGAQGPLPWQAVIDEIINVLSLSLDDPLLLVFDDVHLLDETSEALQILDRLIQLAPNKLHIFLSGRPAISLPSLPRLLSQGRARWIDQSDLAFTAEEISTLYADKYGFEVTQEDVNALLSYTEGWAIALQLIWQSIRNESLSTTEFPKRWQADSLEALFELLAREVLDRQPADVQEFLKVTSTLRDLQPEACDALRLAAGTKIADSNAVLSYLRRQDLFVVETAGGILRYQNIFHDYLRQQISPDESQRWNQLAAEYFLSKDEVESALFHQIKAGAWDEAACLLETYAPKLLTSGRLDTLSNHLSALPPESLYQHPILVFMLGELTRLHSRFDEALGWYQQAETIWRSRGQQDGIARSLRGRARIYLDTVDPSQAEQLLEEALFLVDGSEDRKAQVRLYELLAENKLNSGRADEAEALRVKAENLRLEGPSNDELLFRVQLRTGKLAEASRGLQARAAAEKQDPVQTPRAHRETQLILSLIESLMGKGEDAFQSALEGKKRGTELDSPFVTAVGHMRQGHALMLLGTGEKREKNYAMARTHFEKSVEFSHSLEVPRLQVEADWGLCRVWGYQGELTKAQHHAQQGIEIADRAGDEWIASHIRITMGASLVLANRYEASEPWLNRSIRGFQESSDPFGETAARLWLSLSYLKQKQFTRLDRTLPIVLSTCETKGYGFLFTRPSIAGAPDERIFIPLLAYAQMKGWATGYISTLLEDLRLTEIEFHPGYQLKIQTLGKFQVWKGDELIPNNGWRRAKARLLFQLFITYRDTMLDRDQICEHLWPGAEPKTSERNFKITLNTLYQVLEPDRDPGRESAYIIRDNTSYGLRPEADIQLDTDAFKQAVDEANDNPAPANLQRVVDLYQGEYLPETIYETWAAEERERLAAIFLESADQLTDELLKQENFSEAIDLANRVLTSDNCWERAYRHLMLAYDKLGDHGQVGRTYKRCVQTLKVELDVPPSKETESLFQKLTSITV